MRYGEIKLCDIANGEGVRTSLFVSGCTHHCPGCFNEETWDFSYGDELTDGVADRLVESLEPDYIAGLTVLGGEPMEPANQPAVADLLERVRARFPKKSIWLYTGDTLEELLTEGSSRRTPDTDRLLACVDVLVDGPYVRELKDVTLRFAGSRNQRVIDLPATLKAGRVIPWEDEAIYASHALQ